MVRCTVINKHILLGISGGIAAYKSAELVRLLKKQGCDVRVVMTENARQFISPLTFQALSGHPVYCGLLDAESENAMGHINLVRWADLLLIAPATANCIAKLSLGLADDLLSTVYLAATCPVYLAPAMNQAMWHKPATQNNIQTLLRHGVVIIGPDSGGQACGETGLGRMSEPEAIAERILAPQNQLLQGASVLITAGPTREPLDPIRYISNRSSGKMGYALARAALAAGAKVSLVSGPTALTAPAGVEAIPVETAAQMYQAVMDRAASHDIFIAAAAVADYAPLIVQAEKIKKNDGHLQLNLQKTQDILAAVAALKTQRPFTTGFAAETHDLANYAKNKLRDKNLDMIAANWVGHEQGGFDSEENALQVFWRGGEVSLAMMDKSRLAERLLALIAEKFHEKNST